MSVLSDNSGVSLRTFQRTRAAMHVLFFVFYVSGGLIVLIYLRGAIGVGFRSLMMSVAVTLIISAIAFRVYAIRSKAVCRTAVVQRGYKVCIHCGYFVDDDCAARPCPECGKVVDLEECRREWKKALGE